jgi:hypothetical protein
MSLRDPEKYRDAAWDYSIFNDCFPGTKIRPSDIDFIVERKGHVLVIEFKPALDCLKDGQRYTLECLSRIPKFVVLFVIGEKNKPVAYWHVPNWTNKVDIDLETLKTQMRKWFEKVTRQ